MAKENIIEGLKKLDVANNGHWTQEGSPSLAVLAVYAGEKVSAAELKEAAPDFSRTTAPTYFNTSTEQPAADPAKSDTTVVNTNPDDREDGVGDGKTLASQAADKYLDDVRKDTDGEDPQEAIARLDHELARLRESKQELLRVENQLVAERDKIVSSLEDRAQASKGTEISDYLRGQELLRQKKAEQLKALQEAGVTAKMLKGLIPQQSALDQALKNRRN